MVLCRHGAVSTWHCVSVVLCHHGPVLAGAVIMALCRRGAVSTWHCVGIALRHHGPVLAGAVSTWCDFLDCWNLNIQINSSLDSDLSSF